MTGDIIKSLRKEKGWSQQELADQVGFSREAIKMIETHINEPSSQLLIKLAEVFDVKPSYIKGDSEEVHKEESFAMKLIKELIDRQIITDENISQNVSDLILSAVKLDIERIKKGTI